VIVIVNPGAPCLPDAFVIPDAFCHPDEGGICYPGKSNFKQQIYIHKWTFLLGSLLRMPLRCFVPQHAKNDAFVIPDPLVFPVPLSSPDEGGICYPGKSNFKQRIHIQ